MGLLNGISFQRLQGGMEAATLRQNVLANNVANAETPNFKRSDVSFESILQAAAEGTAPALGARVTDSRHFRFGTAAVPQPVTTTDRSSSMNNNGNNVDIDREMALGAENQLRYNSYITQLNSQLSMMRTAIGGSQ
ncbi:flagellar basal body rod protein FlgB [Paenibacillus spiritus]|uniref:Flagellar basal body rod protein FlgB n=1 Tax=Paenibacillus spiritus TaxID=2496557 RepID=A0A5J5GDW4_9BACL|nr:MULTISPECIES: flagellar basal body rod protein FlgB [Paenibacillus]KAA9006386.1 flagellar basal body rod protein FlgB [Paenibacillus spiritus]